jgi:hypothetical protein
MREGYISRGFGAGAGGRDGDGRRDHRSHPPEGPRDQPLSPRSHFVDGPRTLPAMVLFTTSLGVAAHYALTTVP